METGGITIGQVIDIMKIVVSIIIVIVFFVDWEHPTWLRLKKEAKISLQPDGHPLKGATIGWLWVIQIILNLLS